VVVTDSAELGSGTSSASALCRSLCVQYARSMPQLAALLRTALPQWSRPAGWGVVLLLASLVLSRGLDGAAGDVDEAGIPLVGAHGHCNMELVLLALTGRATSNTFDGDRCLGGGGARDGVERTVLCGVAERSRVGLLSLHDW